MPGSAYHKVATQVAEWLSRVPECKINTSTKKICESLKNIILKEGHELISFDVSSLYTNVPVHEAIERCAELLFEQFSLDISKETFITLAEIASCNVMMLTHDGYYRQIDGLAMGSPPAPHLANGWMSQFDPIIQAEAELYERYMDDIITEHPSDTIPEKYDEINKLHPVLKFTMEREKDGNIPVLDMRLINENGHLSSTWYHKPTDTGLIMNFHSLAPKRYKRSVVSGFVYRIFRACSTWKHFHDSLEKAKKVLEQNQYPPEFYGPIIHETLTTILSNDKQSGEKEGKENTATKESFPLFIQYRGKCSENYARALHKIKAPCHIVFTIRKLRTILPSLKPRVEKMYKSGVVYKINCPRCSSCYVGQTSRHLQTRVKEHLTNGPVKQHLSECGTKSTEEDITILGATSKGEITLLTLEALWIKEVKPELNTKDEYRSRTLTIKL